MEGVGVRRGREGEGTVATTLLGRIEDVLVTAGHLTAELNGDRKRRRGLFSKDSGGQALGAAEPAGVDG